VSDPASEAAAPEAAAPGAGPGTGLFLIDKPAGPTSHDVVQRVRRWTGVRRVGHGGTLDPMATGLLPIFVGRATRLIEYLGEHPKHYRATVRLGVRTDTDDAEGEVVAEAPVPDLSAAQIDAALGAFRGTIEQVPPAFSAVKVGGVTAHRAARRGDPMELAPREVTIHALTVEGWQPPLLELAMTVSTGTYVRAIARDLGAQLGCGGHVIEMRRTGIGPVTADEAHRPADLEAAFDAGRGWELAAPVARFFEHWPRVIPSAAQRARLLNGQAVPLPVGGAGAPKPAHALAIDRLGAPIAVLVPEAGWPERWRPTKVLIGGG
jgi:tRNA pseudouridine55 synthase